VTRPTFLVIGAMKAGTTSLWEYLREQPGVFMAAEKEVDFFVAEKRWPHGVEWYERQFAAAPASALAVGEASTNYSKHPLFRGVPERTVAVLPDVKLVYLVRHPIERMRSQWRHARSAGWESRPLSRAIARDPQYIDVSRYAHQLEQWLPYVPRERVLVETAEQLRDDPATVLQRVLAFVGIDAPLVSNVRHDAHAADELIPPRRSIARSVKSIPGASRLARALPTAVRSVYGRATTVTVDESSSLLAPAQEAELLERLRPDLARLRALVGDPFDAWGLV
jgi:hypothetical protein